MVDLDSAENEIGSMGQGKSISLGFATRLTSLSTSPSCLWLRDGNSFGNSLSSAAKLPARLSALSTSPSCLWVGITLRLSARLASLSTSPSSFGKGIAFVEIRVVSEGEASEIRFRIILSLGDDGGEVSGELPGITSIWTVEFGLGIGLCESFGKGLSSTLDFAARLSALSTSPSWCCLRYWLWCWLTLGLPTGLSALSTSPSCVGDGSGDGFSVRKGGRGDGDRKNEGAEGVGQLHGC
jgi:hypothetical protein